MPRLVLPLQAAAAAFACGCGGAAGGDERLDVYAASSLRTVLPQLDRGARLSFDGSGRLQLKIERGAPADLFLSASPQEPQALHRAGLCTRPRTFATNRLAILVAAGNPQRIVTVADLRGRRLAVAAPGVPAGDYARALLDRMGEGDLLESSRVSSETSVAGITAKVAGGSADAGLAYVTDGRAAAGRVDVVTIAGPQPPIRYAACMVEASAAAEHYLDRLTGPPGRAALARAGFGLPGGPGG